MTFESLLTLLTISGILIGFGWKFSQIVSRIEVQVAEIKGVLLANSARLDRIEAEVKDIDNRVREMEKI